MMRLRTLIVALAPVVFAACRGNQAMFNPQGPAARSIASLGWFLLSVCAVIYVLVLLAAGWALVRRRHIGDDLPRTTQKLTTVIAGATIVSIAILVVFTVSSVVAGHGLTSPSGPGAITVDVIGHQWWWEFQYHDVTPSDFVTSPNELHIPVGVPVHIKTMSRDVIHSFWVPNLHGKRDLIPGQVTNTWIQADRPGVYRGQCAEFCGHQHAKMAFEVVVETPQKFKAWIDHQRENASEPADEQERRGRDVFLGSPCATCHTIRGTVPASRVGPDLTHVGSRMTLSAGTLPNTSPHLATWLGDPQSVKPGTLMPSVPMSDADRAAVIAYLRRLQ